jgi:hypothetical protein
MNWYKISIKLTEMYEEYELSDRSEFMGDFF